MIKNVTVDWMDGYANNPRFIVELDCPMPAYPGHDDPVWTRHGDGLHTAEVGGIVFYFYTDGKPCEGFGGRRFIGTFTNGDSFNYKGAWSSRAACVNDLGHPFAPSVVDVTIGYCSTAVNWADMSDWWYNHPDCGFGLCRVDDGDNGAILLPTRDGKLKNEDGVISQYHYTR
jgi:hypothetical protein